MKNTTFEKESPEKVYKKARLFSKTFTVLNDTPDCPVKQSEVHNTAEYNKASIRFVIDQAKYQNNLFRTLQKLDKDKRNSFEKKIIQKDKIITNNIDKMIEKKEKHNQKKDKHLEEVFQKHVQLEKNKKQVKDENAIKLRNELLDFYVKQKERKRMMDRCQVKVGTCYNDAIDKIDRIHHQNEQYSAKSEISNEKRMARNSHKDTNTMNKTKLQQTFNKKKSFVQENKNRIIEERQKQFIQTYGHDLDSAIKAADHKEKEETKTKERIHKFFSERQEKWRGLKARIDAQKEEVPDKCVSKLDKTTRASFRKTISSFKESGKEWYDKVKQNKSLLFERDELAKDKILKNHLDMRMKNKTCFRINETMGTMRNHAKKLADEYN